MNCYQTKLIVPNTFEKYLLFFIMLIFIFSVTSSGQSKVESKITESKIILPIFQKVLPDLQIKAEIPVLFSSDIPQPKFLPRILPMQEGDSTLEFYSTVLKSSFTEYILTIDLTPNCKGRANCNYAILAGTKNDSGKIVTTSYLQTDLSGAEQVSLANGISGFYIPAPDNPKAINGAEVFWLDNNGNQYFVSLRRAAKVDVISFANSVIENRNPQ